MRNILPRARSLPILLGVSLVIFSIILAVNYQFKSFYEILLLGVLFSLSGFEVVRNIPKNTYIRIYLYYFIAGIIVDLLLSLLTTHLWYYNYHSLIQYVLLYVWIYPAGGFNIVLLFIVFLDIFNVKLNTSKKIKFDLKDELILFFALISFASALVIMNVVEIKKYLGVTIFGLILLIGFLSVNVYTEIKRDNSIFYLLRKSPKKVFIAIFLATFPMAFLHEIPNLYAHQWVYTDNVPLIDTTLLGVPAVVIAGWTALLVLPLSIFLRYFSIDEIFKLIKD